MYFYSGNLIKFITEIVNEAKKLKVPIRIGVNFGSLPPVGKIGATRGISRHSDGVNLLKKGLGQEEKEYEAYSLEDRPRHVISLLKKYCL